MQSGQEKKGIEVYWRIEEFQQVSGNWEKIHGCCLGEKMKILIRN